MSTVEVKRLFHAYMIITHSNFSTLALLLSLLDDSKNDIYLMIDKKAKFSKTKLKQVISQCKYSSVTVLQRKINWGGHSLLKAEIDLIEAATKKKHDYYHLISGGDLPLQSKTYFDRFLCEHYGKEFIQFDLDCRQYTERISLYHFLQEYVRSYPKNSKRRKIINFIEDSSLRIQRKWGVCRPYNITIQKGDNWFSITHDCAVFILKQYKEKYYKIFRYSCCSDELLVQSILYNEPNSFTIFKSNDIKNNLRYIDWQRGRPYVFTNNDYDELMSCGHFFARKFDENVDIEIIERIYKTGKSYEESGKWNRFY